MLGLDLRTARIVWTTFVIVFTLYLAYIARSTMLVVVFAILLSYLLYPLIALLARLLPRRVPRTLAIAVGFVLVISALAATAFLIGPRVVDEATRLGQKIPELMKEPNGLSHESPTIP